MSTPNPAGGGEQPPEIEPGMRFYYIDDSGAQDTGFIVYSWIEVSPSCWSPGLRHWLNLRKELYSNYQVGADEELHATVIYGGRKMPSTSVLVNASKKARRALLERAVEEIGANADIRIGTVYRQTSARGKAYAAERAQVYDALIAHLDSRLLAANQYGVIHMDGDGTDPIYFRAHRAQKLATRRILEDPMFQASHVSQWVQMADLVAWTTYQSLLKYPGKELPASWYDTYLRGHDVNGGPVAV